MRYLLDVNVLLAMIDAEHSSHPRVASWIRSLVPLKDVELATCSITELGFIRIVTQVSPDRFTVPQAVALLQRMRTSPVFRQVFIPDDRPIAGLPSWVKTSGQTTDGHLAQLARSHGATLVSLDRGIPGALVVPGNE